MSSMFGRTAISKAWAPDSESLGFFRGANSEICSRVLQKSECPASGVVAGDEKPNLGSHPRSRRDYEVLNADFCL